MVMDVEERRRKRRKKKNRIGREVTRIKKRKWTMIARVLYLSVQSDEQWKNSPRRRVVKHSK